MPIVTLPDGSQRTFDEPLSVMQLAESIGPGLAKACVAGKIDGVLGRGTYDALERFQKDKGLGSGELTIETLRMLGVNPA